MPRLRYRLLALTVLVLLLATGAAAQQQEVRPPVAQLWIDVATNVMFIPGAPRVTSFPGAQNAFGNTRFAMGRYMDVALQVRTRPQGIQAMQAIPPRMNMGASLPLEPFKPSPPPPQTPGVPTDPSQQPPPKGKVTLYWGCGPEVRSGQPRVIDFATASPQEWGTVLQGRFAPERGATAGPGHSIWPNDRDKRMLPDGNSLQGDHTITGDGVPAGFRFPIGTNQDLMPPIDLAVQGEVQGSIMLQWRAIPAARSYFITAFGNKGNDITIWTSSELPEAGMGLVDYLPPASIDRWTADKVLLPASATQCAVPRGIFAGLDAAIVRMIAHGQELNLVFPPRPTDPRTVWEQQWAVRVRVKSTVMTILGR
ncbi:MAG TPA: hypothetical protein VGR24_03965 [bacterium]|jgi:hypothetical protein|nr:hypothetical protein [bacterium]